MKNLGDLCAQHIKKIFLVMLAPHKYFPLRRNRIAGQDANGQS